MVLYLDTYRKQLPVGSFISSGGTWTAVPNSGAPYLKKSAAADTTVVMIPIDPEAQQGVAGVKLTKIEVPVRVDTAALVSTPTVTLYRRNNAAVAAAGTNMAASTITCSKTGVTLTNAATDRLMTITISSPALDTTNVYSYNLQLTFHAATTSAIRVYGATAYYTVAT